MTARYDGRCRLCGGTIRAYYDEIEACDFGGVERWVHTHCVAQREWQRAQQRRAEWQARQEQQQQRASTAAWPAQVLQLVPREYRSSVYRALAKQLHPDLDGGDTALMQSLNDAMGKLR